VGAALHGVTGELVAVSVPVPAQRFYGCESELAEALAAWVQKVNAWFQTTEKNDKAIARQAGWGLGAGGLRGARQPRRPGPIPAWRGCAGLEHVHLGRLHIGADSIRRPPDYDRPVASGGTTYQAAAAALGCLAYSGRYFVDESTGDIRQEANLDGDELRLSAETPLPGGGTVYSALVWARAGRAGSQVA